MERYKASLVVALSKDFLPNVLHRHIVKICSSAISSRGVFTIALSGGSLPSFLSNLHESFVSSGVDPKYNCWHVILADERCVPRDDPENNLSAIRTNFLAKVSIPEYQVYGIGESKLNEPTEVIAYSYEEDVMSVVSLSGGYLDLAVLGFGPDGHTCSLFPGHSLLLEEKKWVAAIDDSPKPPPRRITLTLPVLNSLTRSVIFCGAGESKSPILKNTFSSIVLDKNERDAKLYQATLVTPALYPSGMVVPYIPEHKSDNSLTWIVDSDAVNGIITD